MNAYGRNLAKNEYGQGDVSWCRDVFIYIQIREKSNNSLMTIGFCINATNTAHIKVLSNTTQRS